MLAPHNRFKKLFMANCCAFFCRNIHAITGGFPKELSTILLSFDDHCYDSYLEEVILRIKQLSYPIVILGESALDVNGGITGTCVLLPTQCYSAINDQRSAFKLRLVRLATKRNNKYPKATVVQLLPEIGKHNVTYIDCWMPCRVGSGG
jgi:hypothetical protein